VHTGFLIVMLLAAGSAHEDLTEAMRLARAGAHTEALARFRAVAAANPSNLESRVWVGRVLAWTGRRVEAEQVLRRVLDQAPDSVDAMLALASVMVANGQIEEAVAILESAETLHPANAETLSALGRVHRIAGRTSLALSYGQRAAALAPGNNEVRQALEATAYQHHHRAQTTFAFEHFSTDMPASRAGGVDLNFRISDRVRLGLQQHIQRKFGRTESRVGAGLEWRLDRATLLRSELFATPGAQVLPGSDIAAEVEHSTRRADIVGSVRVARFTTATVWAVAPGVTVPLNERLSVSGRYYASFTSFDQLPDTIVNHSMRLALRARLQPRLWAEAGYARGNETFETLSIDRIGRFGADTLSTGIRIDNTSLASFNLAADYQRSDDRSLVRLTAGVTQRF
jgi:YaiO family outer membrane protein